MSNIVRATIFDDGIAKKKYETIKYCLDRFKLAFENEFYLEAITLMESLIADRLESRLTELNKKAHTFETLGKLRGELLKKEKSKPIFLIIESDLKVWTQLRNIAIHQAAKIEKDNPKDLSEFTKQSLITAKKGKALFDKLNKEIKKIRSLKIR